MEKIAESLRSTSEQLELNYNGKIMKKIHDFYNNQEFVDVAFNVSNSASSVSAHRLILAAVSPYFRRLFNSAEGECSVLTIAGIDSDIFERLIVFCYNGKALLTTGNVGYMLKGAMQLELTEAVTECANYLMEHLSEYTLLKALALATETGCEILGKRITAYVVANFDKTSQDTVNELSVQQMHTVLLNPVMRTYDQIYLFEVIKLWYEHDKPARELELPNLIGSLQLADIDTEFLVKQIRPLPGCADFVDKAINGREEGNSLLVTKIGNYADTTHLIRYNKEEDEWVKCDLNMNVIGALASVYFNRNIYYIINLPEVKLYSFDLKTKTTRTLPPVQNKFYGRYLVSLDDNIYVVGYKKDYYNDYPSIEMFNPSTNEWQTKADVPTACWGYGAVTLNGKIYVIGGQSSDAGEITGDVHSYDPKTNIWTECAPLAEGRFFPGVAAHKGHIYVLGGESETEVKYSVERYNPERNEWTKVAPLNGARSDICAISFNNELFAIGGWDGSANSSEIEVYDEEKDKWVVKKQLPYRGDYNAYVVSPALLDGNRQTLKSSLVL